MIKVVDEATATEVEPVEPAVASIEEVVPPVSEQVGVAPEPESPVEPIAAVREVETTPEADASPAPKRLPARSPR